MLNVNESIAVINKWLPDAQSCPVAVLGDTGQNDENLIIDNNGEESEPPALGNEAEEVEAAVYDQRDENKNREETQNKAADDSEEEEIQIEPQDSISNVASRTSRKLSRHKHSSITSFSSKLSTASERIRAEAEEAALLARAAALKNKHALEEQEYLLRKKREQLELDTEIAVTSAKLAVLKASGSNKSGIASRHSDGMESYFKREANPKSESMSLNPHATQFVPPSLQQHVSLHAPQGYAIPVSEEEVASDLNAACNDQQLDPTTCTPFLSHLCQKGTQLSLKTLHLCQIKINQQFISTVCCDNKMI